MFLSIDRNLQKNHIRKFFMLDVCCFITKKFPNMPQL